MPFKANAARRHHIPKQRHRVTNWAAYDAALRQRGSLTVWFTDEAIAAWRAEPRTTPGGQPCYSALAILTALTLRAVFRLALRQTEGLIGSILRLLGLDLAVPDHTTLSRRAETLGGAAASSLGHRAACTCWWTAPACKLCGPGEWLVEKHGTQDAPVLAQAAPRRGRRHRPDRRVGADRPTRSTMARRSAPCSTRSTGPVASFTADGAYDRDDVYGDGRRAPSRCGGHRAAALGTRCRARRPRPRRRSATGTSESIAERGRMGWQKASGYNRRALARGGDLPLQAGDRRRAALAHGRAVRRPRWPSPSVP